METQKNNTITAITLSPDTITKTQLKQFWKEHGEAKVKQLTDKAQLCIYDAWEADSISTILKLARKAFKISPFCLDAYNLLAEYEAETYTISKKLYEQAVYAGNILLKSELENDQGYFWGLLETRPYMRALAGLANDHKQCGRLDKSIDIYQKMLVLNPNDNQGIRYVLIFGLLEMHRLNEAQELLDDTGEATAFCLYSAALLAFLQDSPNKHAILQQAIDSNLYIADKLKQLDDLSFRIECFNAPLPDYYSMGSEEEATIYISDNLRTWCQASGAIHWIQEHNEFKL